MKSVLAKFNGAVVLAAALVSLAFAGTSNDAGKPAIHQPAPRSPAAFSTNFTLDTSSPTQDGRLFRDGNPSTCASPKAYPGIFNAGTQYVHVVSGQYKNPTNAPVCATVTLATSATCVGNVFATAYLNSFNAADFSANYLADSGSSLLSASSSESFEVQVPANGLVVFNLSEANGDTAENCDFTLSSPELVEAGPAIAPFVPVPSLGLAAIVLFGIGLLLLGLIVLRRHRKA
ncbi:MAG: hypothetical protein WBW92_11025 [Rhodanobacteraceae bacterium]